jgi:rhodanese-related sulfurtransferase
VTNGDPSVPLTPKEAAALDDHVFLDVREPYEWDAGHVRGSVHIPIGQIQERFQELERDQPIVVVCQVGQRSALVAEFLAAQGYDAHNLDGGLQRWASEGLPLTTDDEGGSVIDGWARDLHGRRLDGTPEG